jgi:hypothetical protein
LTGFSGYTESLLMLRRTTLTPAELKRIAISDIRSRRGCEGIADIEIVRGALRGSRSNWSIRVIDIGNSDRNLLQLTILTVQRSLEKRFTLADSEAETTIE